ncbi:YeeE/YedE family protein [Octadecabacter sp. G9-8]|uniref:YeeE/YedE family protein n=1 Tax=Octadecabacter dasysiphoniae TaxID=2909341 RepID=A0ABS9CZ73_9RHOB|nr:YeeE/YedE family protein [Octadecabacter dasysiphoniae]MCF2872092.1 YeeE/YedE family protein [Octadecabacter dasysiphoniae]
MRFLITYVIGLIFGMGIIFGGMANPAKVLNFFDIAGTWDPSLAFVMGGALGVTALGYRFVLRRPAPRLDDVFHLPTLMRVDGTLIAGSAAFGVGWGLAGFCPGGALPAIGTLDSNVLIFTCAMIIGIIAAKLIQSRSKVGVTV